VRVEFTSDTGYGDALARVIALGFALADPCFSNPPRGTAVAWTPMGQEAVYARTHALLARTTRLNSNQWPRQIGSWTPGVAGIVVGPEAACGATG
jgi:hypothetical protein